MKRKIRLRLGTPLILVALVLALPGSILADTLALDLGTPLDAGDPNGSPLTTQGTVNGGLFVWVDQQTTGSGVIQPFLTIQSNNDEEGFNTDATPLPLDAKRGGQPNQPDGFTQSLLLSDVPIINISGTNYYQFLLDINENTGQLEEYISLDELQIYQVQGGNLLTSLAGLTPVYDLDGGGDVFIKLNYQLNAGSGAGDMFAYIPTSLFGPEGTTNLILYSQFGLQGAGNGQNSNGLYTSDGYEEWALFCPEGTDCSAPPPPPPPAPPPPGTVPEPGTLVLLGSGLIAMAGLTRKKISR